jgi:hypothetical protein
MPRTRRTDKDGKIYELMRFIVRCNICKDAIESTSEDQFVTCVCKNLIIRGGTEHDRFISCLHDLIIDLSDWNLIE